MWDVEDFGSQQPGTTSGNSDGRGSNESDQGGKGDFDTEDLDSLLGS